MGSCWNQPCSDSLLGAFQIWTISLNPAVSRLLVISDNQEWLIFKISSFIKIPIKIFYQNVIFLITAGGGLDKDSVLSVSFGVTQAPPRSTMSQQVLRKGALVLSIPVSSRLGDGKKAVVHGVECSCRENTLTSAIFILVKQNCERQRCYDYCWKPRRRYSTLSSYCCLLPYVFKLQAMKVHEKKLINFPHKLSSFPEGEKKPKLWTDCWLKGSETADFSFSLLVGA